MAGKRVSQDFIRGAIVKPLRRFIFKTPDE
jgi:hypothetical protein